LVAINILIALWDPTGPCEKSCSFVSREASAAFWTIAPAALAPPGWRALAYTAAIAFGVIISTSRMIMGGHFLSDTIFSGVFTFLIIWVVYALIYRWPRARMDDAAVEMALAPFSIYGRTAIGRLLGNSMRILYAMRLCIAAGCICLSACAGSLEQVVSTDSEEKSQQTNQPTIQGGACAKLSELKIGMTTAQVVSACGQRPIRTSDLITRDAKKVEVWVYTNSKLNLTDDKLVKIFDP
jgi:hypothetical protein